MVVMYLRVGQRVMHKVNHSVLTVRNYTTLELIEVVMDLLGIVDLATPDARNRVEMGRCRTLQVARLHEREGSRLHL